MKIYAIYGCKIIHDEYQTIFDVSYPLLTDDNQPHRRVHI